MKINENTHGFISKENPVDSFSIGNRCFIDINMIISISKNDFTNYGNIKKSFHEIKKLIIIFSKHLNKTKG